MVDERELDSAARALGDAHRLAALEPPKKRPAQYCVRCIFCAREHWSDFWDELDEQVLRCRDGAPNWRRGDLGYWGENAQTVLQDCGP